MPPRTYYFYSNDDVFFFCSVTSVFNLFIKRLRLGMYAVQNPVKFLVTIETVPYQNKQHVV